MPDYYQRYNPNSPLNHEKYVKLDIKVVAYLLHYYYYIVYRFTAGWKNEDFKCETMSICVIVARIQLNDRHKHIGISSNHKWKLKISQNDTETTISNFQLRTTNSALQFNG